MATDELVKTTGIAHHGAERLPSVDVDSFNIEMKDDDGFPRRPRHRRAPSARSSSAGASRCANPARIRSGTSRPSSISKKYARFEMLVSDDTSRLRRWCTRRHRGVRSGARLCDAAVPQDQGLGQDRMHRGRRRLPRLAGSASSRSPAARSSSRTRVSTSTWSRSGYRSRRCRPGPGRCTWRRPGYSRPMTASWRSISAAPISAAAWSRRAAKKRAGPVQGLGVRSPSCGAMPTTSRPGRAR